MLANDQVKLTGRRRRLVAAGVSIAIRRAGAGWACGLPDEALGRKTNLLFHSIMPCVTFFANDDNLEALNSLHRNRMRFARCRVGLRLDVELLSDRGHGQARNSVDFRRARSTL
jgi:hypothetical protein